MKHLAPWCWLIAVLSFGACFSPSFEDNTIQCGPDGECPPGFECVSNVCRTDGTPPVDAGPMFTLTAAPGGNGTGTVTSAPGGINCGSDCTETFVAGTQVALTATASASSTFVGWSGACSGTGACNVTVDADVSVTANFALHDSLVVTLAGNGAGFVTSIPNGINCGSDCTEQYAPNTAVLLTAASTTGSLFAGWSGAGCTGTGTCTVTVDAAKMVTATFSLTQHALNVARSGRGAGTVTSVPAGIDCGSDCVEPVNYNTLVTLTASPDVGSTFVGWSGGGCTGTGTCSVTITAAETVTATFDLTRHALTVTKAGNGPGTVTSTPAGIDCGSDCSENYDYGATVTLSATPSTGSVFAGWSGAGCTGTAVCVVPITTAVAVTATFTLTTPTLAVAKAGNGAGHVSSNPAGIDCGSDCTEPYPYNTSVTLTATPSTGSTLTGWSVAGCAGATCTVSVAATTSVTATFTLDRHPFSVAKSGTGAGTITGVGINCGSDCNETYDFGTTVTLTAAPAGGSTFNGWSGACSGTGTCVVSITGMAAVTATFTLSTHLLTVSKAGTGSGTVTGAGILCGGDCTEQYGFGTNVTLTAAPAAGSLFAGWAGGGCSGAASTCVVSMTSATTVIPTFTLTTPTLSVSAAGGGSGTVTSSPAGINCGADCSEPYSYGLNVLLTATAQSGSLFTGWTGGGCEAAGTGTCTVTMNSAIGVTATFVPGSSALAISKVGNGTGSVTSSPAGINCGADCSENFASGTMVTLTASPSVGSTFTGWSGAGCSGTGTCVITIDQPVTVTATFTLTTHTVTVTKDGKGDGTVGSSPAGIDCGADCSHDYGYGTSVTLTATALPGSTFLGWSGGGCSGTGSCSVSVTTAAAVTATFDLIRHQLRVNKPGAGSGTVTSDVAGISCGADCQELYDDNTTVSLTAAADIGSTFAGWSGACSGTDKCEVTMTEARTVTATFLPIEYELAVTVTGPPSSGEVTSTPAGITCPGDCGELVRHGTSVTLTAKATAGHRFTGWTDPGGACTGTGQCTVTMTQAKTIDAAFITVTHELVVNLAGNGSGSVASNPVGISCGADCTEVYVEGTQVTLTATAASGTVFNGFTGGGCTGASTSCVVTIDAAKSVTATFTKTRHSVTVLRTGPGTGRVATPSGLIDCGTDCEETYDYGTVINLVARAAPGSRFEGWSQASGCPNPSEDVCVISIREARSVTAVFEPIPENLVFVTSTSYDGNLGGLTGADGKCAAQATAGGLPGTYVAWLSTSTASASSRLGAARGWVRVDGKPVLDRLTNLTSANHMFYPIRLDEFGNDVFGATVATGTLANGTSSGSHCANWTSAMPADFMTVGIAHSVAGLASNSMRPTCDSKQRLYCFQIDKATTVKPPVVSARIAFTTSQTWTPGGGLAAADMLCNTEASNASLVGTFKALLATSTASAISRFDLAGPPWARPDHALLAPTAEALGATFPPLAFVDTAPHGNAANTMWLSAAPVWGGASNLVSSGTLASTCGGSWSVGAPPSTGHVGATGVTRVPNWFASEMMPCNATNVRLTCLQE